MGLRLWWTVQFHGGLPSHAQDVGGERELLDPLGEAARFLSVGLRFESVA